MLNGKKYVYSRGGPREPSLGDKITWDDFIREYVTSRIRLARTEKHVYDIRNTLTRSAREFECLAVQPCEVNRRNFAVVLDRYKSQGVKDISVKHMATKVMAAFTWAYEEEIFATDKLAHFKKPRIRDSTPHESVTLEEIGRITRSITESWSPEHAPASRFRSEEARAFFCARDTCMTLWLPETGARIGETCAVTLQDVNVEARTARFRKTKNGDDRLTFFCQDFADGPLADWLAIRTADGFEPLTDRLFVNELGLPVDPYAWGRQFNKYVRRAGIERRIRRHDLRHFSSTAHDRVDRDLSKKIIGHHTDSAHAVYSHREMHELRDAHDEANPVGPLLAQAKAEAEARRAAIAPRKKVYNTKRTK